MNTRPKTFHGILATSIATLFTLTAARAVDYNFGSITENFTLTATDHARALPGGTAAGVTFNDNGWGGVYDRGSERDATYMHFDLSSIAGGTINGTVNLNLGIDATYGGAINSGVVGSATNAWSYPGTSGGITAISGADPSGNYTTGQTATAVIDNTTFQGFATSVSTFNGLAITAAAGSQAHFSGPATLTGNVTTGLVRVFGGTDWSAAAWNGGTSTLSISGASDVSGGAVTVRSGGTVAVTGSATLGGGSFAGKIANGGALAFGSSVNQTLSGAISGSGSLTKSGAGTLTLTGSNSYAGGTTINEGTVIASGVGSGAVTIASGATLSTTSASSTGLAALYYNNSINQGNIASLPALLAHFGGNSPAPSLVNTTTTMNFGGNGTGFPSPYNSGASNFEGFYSGKVNIGAAGTYTFNTSSDDGSMLFIDGQTVVANNFFQGVTTRTGAIALTAGMHDIVIAFNQGGGGYGMNAQISGANDTNMVDINTSNASITPDLAVGSLAGAGSVTLSTGNLITGIDNSSTNFTGVISGIGGVTKFGTGVQTLGGANTFSGKTAVYGGSVQLTHSQALQGSTVTTGGVVFDSSVASHAFTFGGLSGATNLALTDNGSNAVALTVGANNATTTYGGVLSGGAGLTKSGTGTLLLTGNNTYSGATNITSGTLRIATPGFFEGLVSNSNSYDTGSAIPHTGVQLTPRWGATTNAGGNNVYPNWQDNTTWGYAGYINNSSSSDVVYTFGKYFDDGGFLRIDGTTIINSNTWFESVTASITLSPGLHAIEIRFGQGGGGVGTTNGNFAGAGIGYSTNNGANYSAITDAGNGLVAVNYGGQQLPSTSSVVMSNNTTFDTTNGTLTIGSLADASPGSTSGHQVLLGTGLLTIGNDNTGTSFSGVISGAGGGLTKIGTGVQTFSGANTYTGATAVNNGALVLQSTYASSGFAIAGGAVLELNVGSGQTDFASTTFSGTGTLKKTGNGEAIWGPTTAVFALGSGALIDVQGGTLTGGSYANENWSANLSDLNVAGGATFKTVEANVRVNKITGTGTIGTGYSGAGYANLSIGVDNGGSTFNGVIQNTDNNPSFVGSLVKAGSGTITLTGVNTYSGVTTLAGGVLNVATFSDYGAAGGLGNRSADGSQDVGILFRGGTLQYTGATAQSTNRGIRISTNGGATIDASGSIPSATLSFTATSSPDFFENPGNRTLTLTGSNTGDNTFAMAIGEAGGTTSVVKSGVGKWVLTGVNPYTGTTDVNGGILDIDGTIGAGANVVNANAGFTNVGVSQTLGALNIADGAVVTLGENPPAAPALPEFAETSTIAPAAAVPEPGSAALFLGGMLTLLGVRRRA